MTGTRHDADWETITPDFASSFHDDAVEAREQVTELRARMARVADELHHAGPIHGSEAAVRIRAGLDGAA